MDLKAYDTKKKSDEGSWVEIYAPDGSTLDVSIKVCGRDSDVYRGRLRKIAENNRSKKKGLPISELERQSIDIYVACTIEWENVSEDGKELECTPENVRHIYDTYPWVLDQITDYMEDRANFLPN